MPRERLGNRGKRHCLGYQGCVQRRVYVHEVRKRERQDLILYFLACLVTFLKIIIFFHWFINLFICLVTYSFYRGLKNVLSFPGFLVQAVSYEKKLIRNISEDLNPNCAF